MHTAITFLLVAASALATAGQATQTAIIQTKEEIPIGDEIDNLKARFSFPDGSTFSLVIPSVEMQELIRLDSQSGILRTKARLDRETLCPNKPLECERAFNVEVKRADTGEEENVAVRLVINDVNDQRPKFEAKYKQFVISIPESDTPPSQYSLPTAEDKDSDRYGHLKYDLEYKGDSRAYFKLTMEERGGKGMPKLELIKSLDREAKDSYELALLVSDAEYPEERDKAEIIIKVLDANDNKPKWQLSARSITISECDGLHRGLLQLQAKDEDQSERIKYSIGKTAGKEIARSFYISGDYLKQNQSLDYEKIRKKVLYIPLVAEDRGGLKSEVDVELRITDCNDHEPNITVQIIDDKVVENDESEKVLARILVRDEDEGNNGTVDCAIGDIYKRKIDLAQKIVDDPHQTIYKLKKLAHTKFDREETSAGEITIEIICIDKGIYPKSSRKEMKIRILDENDNHPRMEHQLYKFRIRENSPLNTLVGRVVATDADVAENARLNFSLDSDGSRNFLVRSHDNRAEIYSAVTFDRELRDVYRFTLIVTDGGQKEQRSATATVEVTVDDEDDSAPVFRSKEYTFRIEEDYDRNVSRRLIGRVEAIDEDIGINQIIWYEVNRQYQSQLAASGMGGLYFYFNNSHLYGDGNFDREKQETISLEIFARNRGPADHRGAARVTITLLDVNDNAPVVRGLHKLYNLTENSPAGTQVLQVKGTDEDVGENGTVSYRLEGTDFGHFGIDASHGIVTLISSLKDKVTRTYKLNIRAQDNGRPPLYSEHYSTFVHISSGQAHRQQVDAPSGSGGKVQRGLPESSDQNLLILLCLAAVVFVVFLALLVILLYVHARGRREARTRSNHPGVWYDKANGEIVEDPSEATETGVGISGLTMNAEPTAGSCPGSTIVRNKFPSFGYIASIDKQRGSQHSQSQQQHHHYPAAGAGGYYETYGKGSDRLPRKTYILQADCASSEGSRNGGGPSSGNKEYSNLVRVKENRYAEQRQQHPQQQPGYAMLAEAALPLKQQQQEATATVCRTPYMTSSFV